MKIKFRSMWIYNKQLNNSISKKDWNEVRHLGKRFLDTYFKEVDKITALWPKMMKKDWPKEDGNEIEAYFVKWNGPSFSHPLTLKVRKDPLLMLVIFAHELGHHFIEDDHKKLNDKVEKIFKELNINAEKQISFMRNVSEK